MSNVKIISDEQMELNTFVICCPQCGYTIDGVQQGTMSDLQIAAIKYQDKSCPNGHGDQWIAKGIFEIPENKYSKEHPYYIS